MKNIIGFIAITSLLFACSKTDIPSTENSEAVATEKAKGGNGNGGGGGGGGMTVTTVEASYILPFEAKTGGSVSSSGGGSNVTERGVCFSTDPNPTIDDETVPSGSGSGTFTSFLSGLDDDETYFVRAYANKNKKGVITTTYGNEVSFTTPELLYGDDVTDIDGNIYTTILIGTQWWMVENLKTTKYRDGTLIPNVTDDVSWEGLSSGAYCDYDNDTANGATYGRLYNGYAIDDERNIAPEGWHVATGDDVWALLIYVAPISPNGGSGGKLKEAGFTHWVEPNAGATNSCAFTALPGGFRRVDPPQFMYLGEQGRWWASNSSGEENLEYFYMGYNHAMVRGSISGDSYPLWPPYNKSNGYSVRCVKD